MTLSLPPSPSNTQSWRQALPTAADWCTAVLLTSVTGVLIAQGHDGLAYTLGILAAAFIWAALVVPALAAFPSAPSLPAYLAARCQSPTVGRIASTILLAAFSILLAAEIIALESILRQFAPFPGPIAVAIGAAVVGGVMALRPTGQPGAALSYSLGLGALAVIPLAVFLLDGSGNPGALVSIPTLGDITALEQSLLEKRLADPATFKPHTVPFLRTNATNFAALVVLLGFGLAMLARARLDAADTSPDSTSSPSRPLQSPSQRAARAVVLVTAIIVLLPPLAAAAKRALLIVANSGLRPQSLPEWLSKDLALGHAHLCGVATHDAAALAKACGKGVGPQGFIRWGDFAISPDQMLFAAFDASLTAPAPIKIAFALVVVIAAIWTARRAARLAYEIAPSLSTSASAPVTALLAVVTSGALIAVVRPADPLTLMTWSAALAASAITPVLVACSVTARPGAAASIVAMIMGASITAILVLAARYAPVDALNATSLMQAVPATVIRKLSTLQDALAAAADGPGKDALRVQLQRLAVENLNWFGIKPIASGIYGLGSALLIALVGSLMSRHHKP